ncbi:phosphonate C-P lyase system protein PhnH [Trinickia symbiotica]|uniref:Phosphonate C-P lyase system protein PhnH n=1 Tax=Trinickia symbiotica TaxID=863227 RepID=A0A2N7X149_9BURK|nr:phosphonate C-P lyase system protein PhnH [Trinickia symbiotica]PMS35473.1 phosphonate C-P lyase system protein PhnH [Trinickia symbiotica]
MMIDNDKLSSLDALVRGFDDPVHDAQACFRVLLDALARPGTAYSIDVALGDDAQRRWPAAAFAALLTLVDFSTPVWLQRRDESLAQAIRFHTGAPLADAPEAAAFAYIADAASLPAPDAFSLGTPEEPQGSATLLIRVDALEGGRPLTLSGPGIRSSVRAAPLGIADTFWHARAALATQAPCGVDCYLVCGRSVIGIPRTTRVELN